MRPTTTGIDLTLGEGRAMMGSEEVFVLHADGTLRFADQPEDMKLVVSRAGLVDLSGAPLVLFVEGGATVGSKPLPELAIAGDRVQLTFEGTTTVSTLTDDGSVSVVPPPSTLTHPLRIVASDPQVRRTILYLMTVVPYVNHLRTRR